MSYGNINEKDFYVYICCDKNVNLSYKSYETYDKSRQVILNVSHDKSTNVVHIIVWNAASDIRKLLFNQEVEYIKDQRYSIYYNFEANEKSSYNSPLDFSRLDSPAGKLFQYPDISESDTLYKCKKLENPKSAKKEFNALKKSGLVKVRWSSYDNWYIPFCEACHVKGSGYVDCEHGRVFDKGPAREVSIRKWNFLNKNNSKNFIYRGELYEKIPSEHWDRKTFYNKAELEEVSKKYYPNKCNYWRNRSEFEDYIKKSSCEIKDFDEAFKQSGNYWRDNKGEVILIKDGHTPMIGSYEPVVSIELIRWKNNFDFDKIWNSYSLYGNEITEDEHVDNKSGGAWRSLSNKDFIVSDTGLNNSIQAFGDKSIKDGYEKVVTKGWHGSYIKDSVECPICKRMYELTSAVDYRTPIQKLLYPFMSKITRGQYK